MTTKAVLLKFAGTSYLVFAPNVNPRPVVNSTSFFLLPSTDWLKFMWNGDLIRESTKLSTPVEPYHWTFTTVMSFRNVPIVNLLEMSPFMA